MGRWIHAAIAATAILSATATSHARETVELGKIGWTPLHRAAEEGSVEKIDALLFGGHAVDELITAGRELKRLKDVVEGRAEATIAEIERWGDALSSAVENALESLRQKHALEGPEIGAQVRRDQAKGISPKPKEIAEALRQQLESLLDLLKVQIVEGATALHIATVNGRYAAAKRLIEKGADVNAQTEIGMHPVDFAAMADEVQLLTLMLEHGADPEEPSTEAGLRPLHWAAVGNALQTTRELLKRGVAVNARTIEEGATAMDAANQHGAAAYLLRAALKQHGGRCAKNC